jgi:hypothetical protein
MAQNGLQKEWLAEKRDCLLHFGEQDLISNSYQLLCSISLQTAFHFHARATLKTITTINIDSINYMNTTMRYIRLP